MASRAQVHDRKAALLKRTRETEDERQVLIALRDKLNAVLGK
jgi:hypothetical protein